MNLAEILGRAFGIERIHSVERFRVSLAAPWVQDAPAWLVFGCLGLTVLAVLFYARYQHGRYAKARMVLAVCRALTLCLVLLMLAEPVLTLRLTSRQRPSLWLLLDGTDSMAIADELPAEERARLARAVSGSEELPSPIGSQPPQRPTRADYVRALLARSKKNPIADLADRFRMRAFLFDSSEGVRLLEPSPEGRQGFDPAHLADQVTTDGQVTALGTALGDLAERHATDSLAGLVVLSDFNNNAGLPVLEAAKRLGVKLYSVGVGPTAALDLGVDLQAPPVLKKGQQSTLTVTLRQQGLAGQQVTLKLLAESRDNGGSGTAGAALVHRETVLLSGAVQTVEIPYEPTKVGQTVLTIEVDPLEGEVVRQNNRAQREVAVRDDFLRILFVEYEPTWEWRFIKEVFHRDELVGERGFRTFLRSADLEVRRTNELFLDSLSLPRSEFFAYDVIFLGDMPVGALSPTFCRMTREFVGQFGGGLVVVAGPRFGPGQLADTRLADMLPVVVDPSAQIRQAQPFRLQHTVEAQHVQFMRLGSSRAENERAWRNLGLLPWYQPVLRPDPLAVVLAQHPTHTCVDGKQRQPLIATRQFGRGEVVYIGFNETWRLRRKYAERYHAQFWGQMIHRLGWSRAPGAGKRFVVRTDRTRYQAGDPVVLTVEAYDEQFQPLTEQQLPERKLQAEWILPESAGPTTRPIRALGIHQLRNGVFEARFDVLDRGEHRVRVTDPIAGQPVEISVHVAAVSAERERAVRDIALQEAIAQATGGKSCDLADFMELVDQIRLAPKTESRVEVVSLWNTWLFFGCVMLLLLGEWLVRKLVSLP